MKTYRRRPHRATPVQSKLTVNVNPRMLAAVLACMILSCAGTQARAELVLDCGPRAGGFGPFDYTNPLHVRENLSVVERYHFTSNVEQLISGERGRPDPMADIAYTLRAFPNHHRALYSMVQYQLKMQKRPAPGSPESADCWFHSAIRMQPQDSTVLALYGVFLHRTGEFQLARQRYEEALKLSHNPAEIHYNLGLVYIDLSDYESSMQHARRAYALGYPLPGLREKLKRAGAWRDVDSTPQEQPPAE